MISVPLPLPWLEVSILIALVGGLCVSRLRDPILAWRCGVALTGAIFACTLMACYGFYLCRLTETDTSWGFLTKYLGRPILAIDELNAPLLPMVALLHFLTAL